MKDLQIIIQHMLADRKNHIRVISMITALSLIMMFVMPFTEIMRVEAEGEDYFTAVVTDPPGDGVDFGGKINTIKINGNEYTNDSGNIVDAGNGNNYQFSMALSYEYDRDQLNNSGILTSKTIYYQVPQDIKIDKDYYGAGEYVNDNKYSDTLPSGYYSISKNGLIVIRFTDAYISYLTQRGGLKGDIAFNGMVERDQTPSGDKTVNVANKEITFEFADEQLSINKSGSTGLDASGKQYINWNITINNPNGHFNLSDYSIKDTITDNDGPFDWTKVTDVTVDPAGAATQSGDSFTLSGNAQQVNISYKTPAENLHTYKNDAIIKKGDEEIVSDSETIPIVNRLEVNKSGVADYTYSGKEGKKAKWTIELKNQSGGSLNNTKITDTMDFPADTKVYYFDSSNQRVELDSSKYSIDGKEITFTDPTLPSRLVVEYEANITGNYDTSGQIQVDNGVKAESTEPNGPVSDPENGYKTATVYYQHQYKIDKSCTRFNTEDDMLQWKIDVNAGKASLDGYEITDSGFVGKTYNNNEREGDYISFNAWDSNGSEIDAKVQLVKENSQSNKITIKLQEGQNVKIAKMEIYYNQPIQDNLSSDDLSKYRNGENVTVRNEADGTMPGTGITDHGVGEKEGRKRREASKHYHSTANEQVIGNADQADRTLDWSVTLTNDNGFGNNDVYTDTLKSDNGGKHYITSDQAAAFSLKSGTTPIPATAYTITFYDENNNVINFPDENKKAVKFKIQFNNSINSSYHSLSLDYKTTAEVSGVENGNTAHFNNGYDYGTTQDKTTDGLTFVREDPTNVKTISINVRKTWNDRNNKFNTRPDDYTVEIWRAKVDSNGDCPVANDPDAWEIVNTYNLTKDQDQLTGDFPQWVVETDDEGIQSVVRYCYKIVETNIKNGYTNTNTSPPIIADHDANFELTNKKDLDVIKIAVDKDGKPINSADFSTVPKAKVDIDGTPTDCYIFGWEIFFKDGDNNYTDKLPEGAVYLPTSSDSELSKYNPYPWGDDKYTGGPSWAGWEGWNTMDVTYDSSENELRITRKSAEYKSFRYYTAIPTDKIEDALGADRKLINTVIDNADHKEYTGTLNVNGDAPDDTQHLKKGANKTLTAGEVVYSLDVNPTGKKMSNEDYINITDALEIGANSSRKTGLKFVLDRINVYPYDENGQVDKDHPIEDYSYTVDYDYSEEKAIAVTESSEIMKDGAYVTVYSINGWDVGDSITLIAERNPECDTQSPGEIYMFNENFNINSPDWNNNLTKQQVQFPQYSNDQSKIEKCVIPENTKYIFVLAKHTMEHVWNPETNQNDIYHKNRMKSLDATAYSKTVPAYLNIDVPDQQHLYVEYKYIVKGFQNGDNITLTNTASFEEDNGSGWDKVEGYQLNLDGSNASSGTNTNPKIYKVDINNYSLNTLEASFKVAKWDKENERWVYASAIQNVGSDIRKFVFPTNTEGYLETVSGEEHYAPENAAVLKFAETDDPSTPSNDTVHEFKMEDKALYKFVEIESPQNYRQVDASGSLEDNSEFVFYYAYNGYDGATPDDAMADGKSKIRNISAGNNINIPNSQFISIKAQKSFTGTDIPGTAEVKLGLYYSTSRNGKNLTAVTADMVDGNDFENPTTLYYTKSGNAPEHTWTGLPSGINGSPVYYFVKEESCTYDGTTYTRDLADDKLKNGNDKCTFQPVYTRNGTNKDGTVIEVNNSQGIAVKKIWQKSDGTLIPNPNLSIQYEVYGIKGSEKPLLYYSGTLSLDNGFQQILPQSNDAGKSLSEFDTFEVKEINPPEGWTTSTTRKLENGTGTLEIINTQEVEETTTNISVKKVWDMNGSTQNHPSSVNVKLIQSLDSIAPGNVTESNGVATPDFGNCIAAAEQTLNEDNGWEFTWNDLPKKNAADQTYYYYVIEKSDYPGYTVSYSMSNQNTLTTITNTFKKVDLKVNKLWAGDDNKDHSGETIKFVIKRSTNPDDVPNNGTNVKEDEIHVPEKTFTVSAVPNSVYVGASVNLSATFGNDDVTNSAVFYVDGNQIDVLTFTFNEVGNHTVKATYHGKVSEVTVTVKEKQLTIDPETETIYEGHNITFTSKYGGETVDDVVYTVYPTDADVNGNKITFNAPGTYTVTATYNNDKHATANITVNPVTLTITPSDEQNITAGDKVTFSAALSDGSSTDDIKYYVSKDGGTRTEASGNEIKFSDPGTYKVTAEVNEIVSNEVTVNVEEASNSFSFDEYANHTMNLIKGTTYTFTTNDTITSLHTTRNGNELDNAFYTLSKIDDHHFSIAVKTGNGDIPAGWNEKIYINGNESKYINITTSDDGGSNQEEEFTATISPSSIRVGNTSDVITITASDTISEIHLGGQINFVINDKIATGTLNNWVSAGTIQIEVVHDYKTNTTVQLNVVSTTNNTLTGQTMKAMFFTPYQAAAPTLTSARSKRPLRGGNITKTVGAEALENEVTELFFNTNVSDIIELGAGKTPSTMMNVSIVGGKVKLKANKQGAGDTDSEWTKTINGLPATDENNQPYYYWVEEVDVAQDYTASYTDNNVDAVNTGGNAEITITNTKKNDTGVELPISGGSGLNTIYTIGAVLLMMSGAGYTMYRRRRWYDE